jgi:hypothetical protein
VISTVASSKNPSFLTAACHRGQFLALQMVNFSSLYDDRRDAESFHRYRRDALVNALIRMVVSPSISVSSSPFFWGTWLGGKL